MGTAASLSGQPALKGPQILSQLASLTVLKRVLRFLVLEDILNLRETSKFFVDSVLTYVETFDASNIYNFEFTSRKNIEFIISKLPGVLTLALHKKSKELQDLWSERFGAFLGCWGGQLRRLELRGGTLGSYMNGFEQHDQFASLVELSLYPDFEHTTLQANSFAFEQLLSAEKLPKLQQLCLANINANYLVSVARSLRSPVDLVGSTLKTLEISFPSRIYSMEDTTGSQKFFFKELLYKQCSTAQENTSMPIRSPHQQRDAVEPFKQLHRLSLENFFLDRVLLSKTDVANFTAMMKRLEFLGLHNCRIALEQMAAILSTLTADAGPTLSELVLSDLSLTVAVEEEVPDTLKFNTLFYGVEYLDEGRAVLPCPRLGALFSRVCSLGHLRHLGLACAFPQAGPAAEAARTAFFTQLPAAAAGRRLESLVLDRNGFGEAAAAQVAAALPGLPRLAELSLSGNALGARGAAAVVAALARAPRLRRLWLVRDRALAEDPRGAFRALLRAWAAPALARAPRPARRRLYLARGLVDAPALRALARLTGEVRVVGVPRGAWPTARGGARALASAGALLHRRGGVGGSDGCGGSGGGGGGGGKPAAALGRVCAALGYEEPRAGERRRRGATVVEVLIAEEEEVEEEEGS